MPVIQIPTAEIHDWESFHDVFATVLGFPEWYGRNPMAWIECIDYCEAGDAPYVGVHAQVQAGDILVMQLEDADTFAASCPAQYEWLQQAVAFVNWRRIEQGQRAIVTLSFRRRDGSATGV